MRGDRGLPSAPPKCKPRKYGLSCSDQSPPTAVFLHTHVSMRAADAFQLGSLGSSGDEKTLRHSQQEVGELQGHSAGPGSQACQGEGPPGRTETENTESMTGTDAAGSEPGLCQPRD